MPSPDQNMAAQCLAHPAGQLAIVDLTGQTRRDITYGTLAEMADGLARSLDGARAGR